VTGSRRTNGSRVDTLDLPASKSLDAPPITDAGAAGEVRPALSPAQLAFLALIAALILTAIRRLRPNRGRAALE
jgi:hypothetical protein